MQFYHNKRYFLDVLILVLCLSSCSKFIEVDPPYTGTSTNEVFTNNAQAASALTAIYMQLSNSEVKPGSSGGIRSIIVSGSLYSDELATANTGDPVSNAFYTNQLTSLMGAGGEWENIYNKIYEVNAAIEGLSASNSLTPSVKQQLTGEAFFLRGFFYFYLVNMFGDVPLALTTDYKVNAVLSRTSAQQVYSQVINDLTQAESLLMENYMGGDAQSVTSERVRPNKAAAEAMLARVYLYQAQYAEAENYATKIIDRNAVYELLALENVFLKNSKETIWSIPSINSGNSTNTVEGREFVVSETNNMFGPSYQVSEILLNSFEEGDERKSNWIGYALGGPGWWYFPNKYKIGAEQVPASEYSMVLRLAEMYLVRAEARAMQNNIEGAQNDLDVIRHRAGLASTTASTQESLMEAITHERYVELFTEWGHRFFDLKRLNLLDQVLGVEKPQYWNTDDKYFPIPQADRNRNPNLTQNPGYN